MPVLKVKKDGVWEEISGFSEHAYDILDGKSDIDHQHTASEVGAVPITGGILKGALTTRGIILTEGIDYGSGDPGVGVLGQLYFKKVT